jgi:hypothetical protein
VRRWAAAKQMTGARLPEDAKPIPCASHWAERVCRSWRGTCIARPPVRRSACSLSSGGSRVRNGSCWGQRRSSALCKLTTTPRHHDEATCSATHTWAAQEVRASCAALRGRCHHLAPSGWPYSSARQSWDGMGCAHGQGWSCG